MGNLTILTQELNSDASNAAWTVKKPKLLASSLLPINQQLHVYDKWTEDTITQLRFGKDVLQAAKNLRNVVARFRVQMDRANVNAVQEHLRIDHFAHGFLPDEVLKLTSNIRVSLQPVNLANT